MSVRSEPLDVLRGVAVALVVGYHFWPRLLPNGDIGVDLFFVLSGYLIGGGLLDNRDAAGFFSTFYVRRAVRILPIYWVLVLLSPGRAARPLWWFLTFTQTIGWSVHRSFPAGTPLSVTWSLAVEEQFYLVLPLLVRFVPVRWFVRVAWCLMLLAPACRYVTFRVDLQAAFLLLPDRMDTLMGGVLMACVQRGIATPWSGWMAAMLAAPALAFGLHLADPSYGLWPMSAAAAGLSAWVLVVGQHRVPVPAWLRPLAWVGVGSYTIYLFHLPVLHALDGRRAEALAVLAVLSFGSWQWMERPLIGLARRRWRYERTGLVTMRDMPAAR